jgi:hypothetical protein
MQLNAPVREESARDQAAGYCGVEDMPDTSNVPVTAGSHSWVYFNAARGRPEPLC